MFKDYYLILDIYATATSSDIKKAYKKQAKKWHPDVNPDSNTTERMKDINEAYLILNDSEARERYDKEYQNYYAFKMTHAVVQTKPDEFQNATVNEEYEIQDETLNTWMNNARKQAAEYVKMTLNELLDMLDFALKETVKYVVSSVIYFSIFIFIILLILQTC